MSGYSWTEEEKALIIWFASIGLTHANISKLLHHRNFNRSMTAIRNKIAEVRRKYELGETSNKLNLWEVDNWIRQLSLNCDPTHLLMPTLLDQQIIYKACTDSALIQSCELNLGQCTGIDALSIHSLRYGPAQTFHF